ncbi:MAG: hypothetical protein IKG56_05065 [Clostridia bacterium]|nr:hypothetical protein [Clostridia bacterium]
MTKSSELVFDTMADALKAISEIAEEFDSKEVMFYTRVRCDGKIILEVFKKMAVD